MITTANGNRSEAEASHSSTELELLELKVEQNYDAIEAIAGSLQLCEREISDLRIEFGIDRQLYRASLPVPVQYVQRVRSPIYDIIRVTTHASFLVCTASLLLTLISGNGRFDAGNRSLMICFMSAIAATTGATLMRSERLH